MSPLPRHGLIIGGTEVATAEWMDVTDPGTGEPIAQVGAATPADVDRAVEAARIALAAWRATPPLQRGQAIGRFARELEAESGRIAALIHREEGKPLVEAQAEVARACEVVHHFAGEAERLWSTLLPAGSGGRGSEVRPDGIGVVAAITPWNFPVALVIWKLAPALAAGCCVVVKPAQEAPLAARAVCEVANHAGLAPGVVSCLTGHGPLVGEALATHAGIDKVAFTGSRRVAEMIAGWAAPRLKALSLELGGHGPLIVIDDADLDVAVDVAISQGYANAGQACYSVNRVLVPRSVEPAFLEKFRERLAEIVLGPMATDRGLVRHRELLADARTMGATVEGGEDLGGGRVAPALVTDAGPGVRLVDQEPFTPVVAVMRYDALEDAITEANRPDYGLVGYVCGRDLRRAGDVAHAIECGTVVINGWRVVVPYAPYAGWRGSGVGCELGRPGLEAFIRWQHVRVLG